MKTPIINRYLIDNMEFMKTIPDNYYDLAPIDPPYGIGATNMQMGTHKTRTKDGYPGISTAVKVRKNRLNSGGGKLKNRILNSSDCSWDEQPPSPEFFKELFRISKNQIIFGGNYFDLPPTRGIIMWDKIQPWENFSQFEYAWTSFDYPAKVFRFSNRGGNNKLEKIAPTEKPVEIYEWIHKLHSKEGFKIIDTHGGSFSHAMACYDLGIDLDILENDEFQFEKSEKRLIEYIQTKEEIKQYGYAKTQLSKINPILF